jgi:hypothetical protein
MPDLNSAVVGEELNPLAFDFADYANIEDMLDRINASDERIEINLAEMSVNGRVLEEPMEKYLATKAISSSAIKEALKSPQHFWFYMNDRTEKGTKKHFELGTFAHMAFLEPELFDLVIVEPDAPLNTKEGVQTHVDFWEAKSNKFIKASAQTEVELLGLDITKMDGKREYIKQLKAQSKYKSVEDGHFQVIKWLKRNYTTYGGGILQKIFAGAKAEVSFYGVDAETGLDVKIRPDAFNIEENIGVNAIISVKTTKAATKGKFELDCASYGYHVSEAMYQKVATDITGRKFNATIMVMLQTEPPYLLAVFWWNPSDLHAGRMRYDHAMQTVSEAFDKKLFPGFDAYAEAGHYGIIQMELPYWIQKEVDPMDIEE